MWRMPARPGRATTWPRHDLAATRPGAHTNGPPGPEAGTGWPREARRVSGAGRMLGRSARAAAASGDVTYGAGGAELLGVGVAEGVGVGVATGVGIGPEPGGKTCGIGSP